MPTEQMYMVELIIKRISLEPGIYITDVSTVSVGFKFAQFINFDVGTSFFPPPELEKDSDNRVINMNYGKTFLFIARPASLRTLLLSDPYVMSLYDGVAEIASVSVPWKREFSEMIKFFESLGIVKSTIVEDTVEMVDVNKEKAAEMKFFMRMSCFGHNVQTMFQIKFDEDKPEYIFRQTNASRTFKIERHSDDRHHPLVAPLFAAIGDVKHPDSWVNMSEAVSLTQLFEQTAMPQKVSVYKPLETDGTYEDFPRNFEDDKISICYRQSENKFFNLLDLISADVRTHDKGTEITIKRKKVTHMDRLARGRSSSAEYDVDEEEKEKEDATEMTADKIARKLCGNADCPAVKKFKEYGIGPLATGKCLGTVYGDVEPPVTYGMSHTYGTMCEYGPYGVFSRPKHEALPFVPRTSGSSTEKLKPCKIKRKKHSCCDEQVKKKKKEPQWHSHCCPLYPERLRGGADVDGIIEEQGNAEEDAGMVMPKSPMIECRSVMNQFDNILSEYKKALGPCGHATCPFAQTIAEETCKKMCEQQPAPPAKEASLASCNDDPCDVEGCPYATDTKKKRYPAGCGSPKCAYTKYKLGLLDDDAEMELKFLPPPLQDNCGDPHCKYPPAAPLPPIHWDCPEPLPKGPCRNLNCPFQPRLLKKFKTQKQLKTGPCGSPMCPYALPQPCTMPTCPFAMRPCPMAEEQKKKSSEENLCENPDCPYAEVNARKGVENDIDDPKFKGEFQDCGNADCPYKKKGSKKKSKKKHKEKEGDCGNPDCPYLQSEKKSKKKKKHAPDEEEASLCSNPECPTRVEMNKNNKNRCQQSSSSESLSLCSDPECPYAGLKKQKMSKKKKKKADDTDSGGSCNMKDGASVCSNPECPNAKEREIEDPNICTVPGCPYSNKPSTICDDPNCPYLKPLPSCGIPNCPYEPVPLRFSCENPKCPSKSINFNRKPDKSKIGIDKERDQPNKAAAKDEEDLPCDNPECDNPDCEMKEGGDTKPQMQTALAKQGMALTQPKKKRKRKKRGKFVYSVGDTYPSTKRGHKECVTPVFNVPPHMGWLWNIFTPILSMKPRRGWRPGALTKTIAARLRAHRKAKGLGIIQVPTFRRGGHGSDDDGPKVVPKPTLQIQKKEGTYWITMNPLKDPFSLVENEDPYMECTPMTFKITKNKKDDDYCRCDGDMPSDLSSSSDSELDIEFTPPAGIIHPERFKKKPNVACCEAQYDPKDFEVPKKDDKKGKGKDKKGKGGKGDKKGKGKKKK